MALNHTDARHHARGRRLVVVHAVGGESACLQKRSIGIKQCFHAFSHKHFPALFVPLYCGLTAAFLHRVELLAQFGDKLLHRFAIGLFIARHNRARFSAWLRGSSTTALISPHSAASFASTRRPTAIISSARVLPMICGSRPVPPQPVMIPILPPGCARIDFGVAYRRSHASAISSPPPMQ